MALQLADAPVQAHHVLEHGRDLGLDQPGLLAHAHVLEDRAHRIQGGHEGGRRDDPHARPVRLLDHLAEAGVELGVDRFAGQEHERRFGGLAGHDVPLGDVADVLAHIGRERAARRGDGRLFARRAQCRVALQRELGIDRDRPRRVGQLEQAVDALAVAQRHLEGVGRRRQDRLDDVAQLDLAEGAARLLVGQDVLQADHLGRQLGDVLLRLVDHRQALAQVAQRGLALGRRFLQPVADALGKVDQALLHGLGERALLGLQALGELGLGRGLAFGHLGQPAGDLGHRARAAPAQEQHRDQRADRQRGRDGQDQGRVHVARDSIQVTTPR